MVSGEMVVLWAEGTGTPRKTNEKMERAEEIISDPGEHFPLEHRFVILFEGKISIIRGDSVVPEYDVLLHYSILIRHWEHGKVSGPPGFRLVFLGNTTPGLVFNDGSCHRCRLRTYYIIPCVNQFPLLDFNTCRSLWFVASRFFILFLRFSWHIHFDTTFEYHGLDLYILSYVVLRIGASSPGPGCSVAPASKFAPWLLPIAIGTR